MLIKFTKSTDFEDRHYSRGDVREFDAATAKKLIDEGVAIDPEKAKTAKEKTAKPETEADASTLVITDLDGDETVVTAVVETPVTSKPTKKPAGK